MVYEYMMLEYGFYVYGRMRHYYHYYGNIIMGSGKWNGSEIIDGIYIGDINDAYNIEELKNRNIGCVISAVSGVDKSYNEEYSIRQINVDMIDRVGEELLDKMEDVIEVIKEEVDKGNRILIHCICGVSRSVSILLGYMMKYKKYSLVSGLELIREKRSVANPNVGFIAQLEEYGKD